MYIAGEDCGYTWDVVDGGTGSLHSGRSVVSESCVEFKVPCSIMLLYLKNIPEPVFYSLSIGSCMSLVPSGKEKLISFRRTEEPNRWTGFYLCSRKIRRQHKFERY